MQQQRQPHVCLCVSRCVYVVIATYCGPRLWREKRFPPNHWRLADEKKKISRAGLGPSLTASPCAQYVTMQKYFLHSSFSYLLFFCNPTQKTETEGLQISRRRLIANHLDQSLWFDHVLLHFSLACAEISYSCLAGVQLSWAFYQPLQSNFYAKVQSQTIFPSQTGMFWFFFTQLERGGSHTDHC